MLGITVWPKWTDYPVIYVGVAALSMVFLGAIYLNIYWLIPRYLLRNKYVSYLSALFGFAFGAVLTTIVIEFAIHHVFQLPLGNLANYRNKTFLILYIFGNSVYEFFFFLAVSVFVFLQHWWKTGKRIRELEEAGVRVELEKTQTKIDTNALFSVLNQAASIVVSLPHEATRILLELSKSLRKQLYESDYKHAFPIPLEKTHLTFDKQHHVLNFLIDKKYRLVRNILFIIVLFVISLRGFPSIRPFPLMAITLTVVVFNVVYLASMYINMYVLIPRLLFKNKWKSYCIDFCVMIFSIVLLYETSLIFQKEPSIDFELIFSILVAWSDMLFFIAVTTAIVIFQHWARNERYIAQLEAATMRAELEQLQNQINPHFLFNMLNNILVLIHENPAQAEVILREMSDMMKYQFNISANKAVLLNEDIQFLTDYLNLEKIRRDRFEFTITSENNVENTLLPPLLFIPFVENAVKHSNDAVDLSYIWLHFGATSDTLFFTCRNSKPFEHRKEKNKFSGIGLTNIQRRLYLLYEDTYSLDIMEDELNYTVQLKINIHTDEPVYSS
jgi:hypothetical protein